ncbi:MAG: cytochrome P450 [Planctomycetota bacterium]
MANSTDGPTHRRSTTQRLPGPSTPFVVDANAESLDYLTRGFEAYGDVWAIPPVPDAATAGADLPLWVLNDPAAIHHVLTKRQADYAKGVGFERVKMLLGDGLIVSDGEHWKKRRRMLQPAFGRPSVAAMGGMIARCIAERSAVWEEHAASGEPLDLTDEANRLGLRIILRSIFGPDLEALDAREGGNPFDLVVDTHERDLMFAMRFRQLWPVVREIAEARRERAGDGPHSHDFLGMYLAARDRSTDEPLDLAGLVDEIMTLVIAGHETSAATIAWAWSLLGRHQDVQAALQEEVQRVGPFDPTSGALERRFDLAPRVVHETLRLYPPVWMFTRRALVDDELAGYQIPAGTQILITPYILHRHPRYWDRPEEFDPSRIPASGVAPTRGAYIPFSSGPRRCAGDGFALSVSVQHLAWVASRYRIEAQSAAPPALDPGVNLRARDPILVRVGRL